MPSSIIEMTPGQIANKGERLYQERLKAKLEPVHFGRFAAIEVETEKYFIGDAPLDALQSARAQFPNKIFYIVRIGYPGVYKLASIHRGSSYGWNT